VHACDGAEAIDSALRERPDLLLVDILMPGVSGYEVVKVLKAEPGLAGTPMIALTALAMVGEREKCLAAGFDAYIAKPVAPRSLVREVNALLDPAIRSVAFLPGYRCRERSDRD